MAIKITRENGGLNRATAGFAAAFPQGLALGMQAKQNAEQQENRRQLTALAVQQAKQVSDQLDRELAQNQAASEAVGVQAQDYANDPTAPLNAGMKAGPGVAAAVGMAQQDKWGKIGEIAKRMKPEAARLFLEDAKSREVQAVNERGLAGFRDKIARITAEGADKSDPEARPWMDPATVAEGDAEYANGLKNLSMMAADPNADPVALDQQLGELIKKRAKSEGAAHGRANQFQGFTDQANNAMAAAGGSFAPEQGRAIRTMMSTFRQAPWIYDDPKAMQAFQAKFQDALQGYTTVGDQRVRFEDEPVVRKMMMEKAELSNRLIQKQIATEESQKAMYESGSYRSRGTSTVGAGLSLEKRIDLSQRYDEMAQKAKDNGDEAGAKFYFNRARMLEMSGGGEGPASGGGGGNAPKTDAEYRKIAEAEIDGKGSSAWEGWKAPEPTPTPKVEPVANAEAAKSAQAESTVRAPYDALDVGGEIGSDKWLGDITLTAAESKDENWKKQALSELRSRSGISTEAKRIAAAALSGDKNWYAVKETKGKTKPEVLAQIKADAKALSEQENAPTTRVPLWKRAATSMGARPKRQALETLLAAYNRRFDEKLTLKDLGL